MLLSINQSCSTLRTKALVETSTLRYKTQKKKRMTKTKKTKGSKSNNKNSYSPRELKSCQNLRTNPRPTTSMMKNKIRWSPSMRTELNKSTSSSMNSRLTIQMQITISITIRHKKKQHQIMKESTRQNSSTSLRFTITLGTSINRLAKLKISVISLMDGWRRTSTTSLSK
jgi:hypothetical protein